eukprot:TRINITY_DN4068_c0_g1_i1.p1 TRINITY_DN4068_c0_g1~~TRINITY_DN4068_c0_g1_i1.p1  ORF type:complete len:363 (-),score=107.85 TRINITY_DN4068_c0_g1_i1:52-1140(-)
MFDRLNKVLYDYLSESMEQTRQLVTPTTQNSPPVIKVQQVSSPTAPVYRTSRGLVVVGQCDLLANVLDKMTDELGAEYVANVYVEFIKSLNFAHLEPEYFLYSRLVGVLVAHRLCTLLEQLIRYCVLGDSASLAEQLLSLSGEEPQFYQLSLDMFARLRMHRRLLEVLLARQQVLPALRYFQQFRDSSQLLVYDPRLFFDAALGINSCGGSSSPGAGATVAGAAKAANNNSTRALFYAVYTYFDSCGLVSLPMHQFYAVRFAAWFGAASPALLAAQRRALSVPLAYKQHRRVVSAEAPPVSSSPPSRLSTSPPPPRRAIYSPLQPSTPPPPQNPPLPPVLVVPARMPVRKSLVSQEHFYDNN